MPESWVCATCRSINPMRSSRCYRCRGPRPAAGEEMAAASQPRDAAPPKPAAGGSPHHTLLFAGITIAFIATAIALRWIGLATSIDLLRDLGSGAALTDREIDAAVLLASSWIVVALLGTVAWAVWLSQVVANVPILGRGWPSVSPRMAIFESIIPVLNLFRAPAVVREVSRMLAADGRGDVGLIGAWWFMLFGSFLVQRPIGTWLTAFAPNDSAAVTWGVVISLVSASMLMAAGIFCATLIARIERRQRELTASRGAAAAGATAA